MNVEHWSARVAACEERGRPYVIVTVLGARGSTPRDSGTKMVVEEGDFHGTIGGGELEHRALQQARRLLCDKQPAQAVENYPLGEKLGQCCGGSVSLLFEVFVPQGMPTLVFGSGHVGRALVPILATLPLRIQWIDERTAEFPDSIPAGVDVLADHDPLSVLRSAAPGSAFVIMTHNHPLDYALAEAALRRGDAAYVGVIGSHSKARRFRLRLEHRGLDAEQIEAMKCPIGLSVVPGKRPSEIAIAVAAQLIGRYHELAPAAAETAGPRWHELRDRFTDRDKDPTLDNPPVPIPGDPLGSPDS